MNRFLTFSLLLGLSSLLFAQEPDWFDSKNRATFYPTSTYFSGFVMDEISPTADVEKATEHIKSAARVEAVSTIQIYVDNVKQDNTRSESYQTMSKYVEEIYQQFTSNTTLTTRMDVPGLKVEGYKNGNIIAAFAYVKKSDLKHQLEKQITMALTRIETQLDNIDELINNGQKVEARSRIKPISKDFLPIEQTQELLLAVDANADAGSLQLEETKALQQRYAKMQATLKNGIYIALHCTASLFDDSYDALPNIIKGDLSSLGCTFIENDAEADWIVTITSSAREYTKSTLGNATNYYSYVDSQINIKKAKTGQIIYTDEFSIKGGDTRNYVLAGKAAYKEIAPKLCDAIKKHIQQ